MKSKQQTHPVDPTRQYEHIDLKKPPSHFSFQFIDKTRIQEAVKLCTNSFTEMNSLWKKLGANYDEVYSINYAKMLNCCQHGWLCGFMDQQNNEIIAVTASQDLIDYVQTIYTHNSQFVKTMDRYAWKTEGELFISLMPTLKRGDCSYIIFGGVKKQLAKTGISRKFWAQELAYLKLSGYKDVYARATSRFTTKLLSMFGGKVINTVMIQEKGIHNEFMELIKINMNSLSFDSLSKHLEQRLSGEDL